MQATDVRKNTTGVHARVTLALNTGILEEDVFNIGRREDRNRLVKAAHMQLNGLRDSLSLDHLQHEMMLFCRGLYDAWIGIGSVERRAGAIERTAPEWRLEPFVLEGAGTILFAPPGRGKSWTGLMWAISVDAGLEYPWKTKQGPALYINLERPTMDRRQGDVNAALGLPRDRELLFLNRRGSTLTSVEETCRKAIEREGVQFVVLDSLSRAGAGDMNDNEPANVAMDILNSFGCAWLALGHTPRGDESHLFGSQMYDAAADVMVVMATDETDEALGIGFKVTKANDMRKPKPQQWAYYFDDLGLDSILPANPGQFAALPDWNPPKERIKKYLLEHGAASATQIATALEIPRTTVSSVVRDTETFVYAGKDGRSSLYGVLSKAM